MNFFKNHIPQADHVPADAYNEVRYDTIREHWRKVAAEDFDLDGEQEPWMLMSEYFDMDREEGREIKKWVTFYRLKPIQYTSHQQRRYDEKLDYALG